MSRIGKLPIEIPAGVTIDIKDNVITVKGPKGELKQAVNPAIKVEMQDGQLTVARPDDNRESRAQHGLYRALINNMVVGVSTGFKKELEIVGVGYRATSKGQVLELALGYSHAIYLKMPPRTLSSLSNHATSNCLDKFAPRFARSASPNLTRAKVLSLLARLFAASQVKRQLPNNK